MCSGSEARCYFSVSANANLTKDCDCLPDCKKQSHLITVDRKAIDAGVRFVDSILRAIL